MPWYLVLPVNISRNIDVIVPVIVTSSDTLPLYCITVALRTTVHNNYRVITKGNYIFRRKGNRGENLEKKHTFVGSQPLKV